MLATHLHFIFCLKTLRGTETRRYDFNISHKTWQLGLSLFFHVRVDVSSVEKYVHCCAAYSTYTIYCQPNLINKKEVPQKSKKEYKLANHIKTLNNTKEEYKARAFRKVGKLNISRSKTFVVKHLTFCFIICG